MNFTSGIFSSKTLVSIKIRYGKRQILRVVLTLSHLRALHDALWETFLKLKVTNNRA